MSIARSTDLTELAASLGYQPVPKGRWHILKELPHIVIKQRNRYYDNYSQKWGDAISFLQEHSNKGFAEAVETLLAFNGTPSDAPAHRKREAPVKEEKAEFILPEESADHRRVYAYLRKRGIAQQVIGAFLSSGLLYEDKEHHNCIFVGKDSSDQVVFAYKRGTCDKDGVGFKGDVPGSDKDVAFRLPCDPTKDTVHVFESPIDLMSFQTLHRELTSNAVALCCLYDGALETYLKENFHIKTVTLCLDADQWGRKAAERMTEKYREMGYTVYDVLPPVGKDWNEHLQQNIQRKQTKSHQNQR